MSNVLSIESYEEIIKYLLVTVNVSIKEDINQDLYLHALKIIDDFNQNRKPLPNNIDAYMFISLRNHKIKLLQNIYKSSLSLNEKISSNLQVEYIDIISDKSQNIEEIIFSKFIKSAINELLTSIERQFITEFYYLNRKQIRIAKDHNVTQQYVSKTLKKAQKKLSHVLM